MLAELERDIAQASQLPPPLKKFKALFDETDPDRQSQSGTGFAYSSLDGAGGTGDADMVEGETQSGVKETQFENTSGTQTEGETQAGRAGARRARRLPPVAEEVEESQRTGLVPGSSMAGVPPPSETVDMIIDGDEEAGPSSPPTRKAKAPPSSSALPAFSSSPKPLSHAPGTAPPSKASAARGAEPGKHDTDVPFLKALASTKKGKKHEDDFDREFNNLRISKPELQKDAQAREWEVLADFGDDGDLRGNFMVVVEMELPEKPARGETEVRVDWHGKPNFKRFRKVGARFQHCEAAS